MDSQPAPKPIVISLHGIRTHGAWQKRIIPALAENDFIPVPLDFGFFRAIQLVIPSMRDRKVEWLLTEYTKAIGNNRQTRPPSIIAHSLGTYLVARLMEKYELVRFDQIIFCGSIVYKDYPWTTIVKREQVTRVLNDYGGKDIWAKAAQWVVNDAGPSGAEGFSDRAGGCVIARFHPDFHHSDFFHPLNYEKVWVPFLQGRNPQVIIGLPNRPTNWKFRALLIAVLISVFLSLWFLVLPRSNQTGTGKSKHLPANMPRAFKEAEEAKRRLEFDPDKLTLYDLFITDFSGGEIVTTPGVWPLAAPLRPTVSIESMIVWNLSNRSEFISFYIPATTDTRKICVSWIANNIRKIMQDRHKVSIQIKPVGQSPVDTNSLVFSNRIFIYHETYMTPAEQADVDATFKALDISVIFRSSDFLIARKQEVKIKLLQKSK